ncbi:RagB/SusD family nutrient uptake outer membrane protein [Epilithonimonas xixisoli]|uniref:SusD-like starch-binding protein associating with outer membrane n=1 Tax=Epilithonimonas xixisoli TaxID=1476462 RepID=A0A4R8IGS2_9FLAO|nr:RagB/SusD family nutrient uptake outer membrane protein [Epilithonimonas xixisoli]TDX86023.1 SusD-like starch-binding protein associating with outer membrane [Epilithonimonas xixisoli]
MNKIIKTGILAAVIGTGLVSCSDDFVDREFYQEVQQGPLKSTQEMQSFVRGAYVSMRNTQYYGADFLAYAEIRSDEMYSTLQGGYYTNVYNYTQVSNDPYARDTYNRIYEVVGKANIVINSDINALQGTAADKSTATFAQGQAYGLRAIAFFDAFRIYGQKYIPNGTLGIVLPLKYDPKALMPRATIAETEAQIDADFTKALQLMSTGTAYSNTKADLSVNALKGMMSRYYLYKGDYAKVRSLTNDLIGKYSVIDAGLHQVSFRFLMNGAAPNSIFELAVGINASLSTGSYRQRLNPLGYGNIVVSTSAYNSYASNDIRRNLISTSGTIRYLSSNSNDGTGKYTNAVGADNIKMLRYEEILLNGIEAELNGGDPAKALSYYRLIIAQRLSPIPRLDSNGNPVIDNDGNPVMDTGQDQANKITSVTLPMLKAERMKELLGEGLRQWDLRRWGDPIARPSVAPTDPNLNAFPIPRSETDIAGTPVLPNPGYDNSL